MSSTFSTNRECGGNAPPVKKTIGREIDQSVDYQGIEPLRLGAVGLGRGFALTARGLSEHPGIIMVAGATRNESAGAAFKKDFNALCYSSLAELCANPDVEMVYVATPHALHCEHVKMCARTGKHIVVEKPMAITLPEARRMVDVCNEAGVLLLVGPSHSFDAPVLQARQYLDSGQLGRVRMIHALNTTDFLYRPRSSAELDTAQGGGVIFSQAVHQVDVVRRLSNSAVEEVYAVTGSWDAARPTEGAYTALLRFVDGASASLTYSGYAHYDTDDCMGGFSELGMRKNTQSYGRARQQLAQVVDETAAKAGRRFSGLAYLPQPENHEHFGPVTLFCENGDIRLHPGGIEVFEDHQRQIIPCPFDGSRKAFCDSLVQAVRFDNPPAQNGQWGLASLEICVAMLESHTRRVPVRLKWQ